jgi:type IV pilus assembly protein PilN
MIRINLLPYREARKKENLRRHVSIFFLAIVFTFLSMFYLNNVLNKKIKNLGVSIENTKTQIAKYKKINQEIARIIKNLDILKKKLVVIGNLELERTRPVKLLEILTQVVIPKRMWLTNLLSQHNLVTIKGNALDNKTIADFMIRLETTGLFTEVNLRSIRQKVIDGRSIKQFEINCTKMPVAPKTAAKSKANEKT